MMDYDDDSSINQKREGGAGGNWFRSMLSSLPFLAFFSFVCYALSVSNTTAVQDACGAQLWQFTLAHLVVPMGLALVIIIGTVGIMACCLGFSDQDEAFMPIVFGIVGSIVMMAYSSLFLGFGVPIVQSAMNSPGCVAALSDVSFTRTPLLGILGCIYLAFDGLVLLSMLLIILFGCCMVSSSTPTPPINS
jgi:hypothetical protein